jgi:hypothetical protein
MTVTFPQNNDYLQFKLPKQFLEKVNDFGNLFEIPVYLMYITSISCLITYFYTWTMLSQFDLDMFIYFFLICLLIQL